MKKQITAIHKSRKKIALKIYFSDDVLMKRVEKLADDMGLSVSSAGGMIIRYGLPVLEKTVQKIFDEK